VEIFVREDLQNILRKFALEVVTVDDSVTPPAEKEDFDMNLPFEYQPRDAVPEPGTDLLFCRQGPLPQNSNSVVPSSLRSPSPAIATAKSPLGGVVVLDRIDRERDKEKENKKEKAESFLVKEKERVEREKEKVAKERQEREKERIEKEKEKERAEKEQREREQKERDRHERQERHNLNLLSLSTSLPASPRSPSLRGEKKVPVPEAVPSKLGSQSKPPPSLASTLLTATAAIAGKKSKHINLNSDDDDDDDDLDDDEELMDI
jgi:hypothetical protein